MDQGLEFAVSGFGFRDLGLGFGDSSLGFGVCIAHGRSGNPDLLSRTLMATQPLHFNPEFISTP